MTGKDDISKTEDKEFMAKVFLLILILLKKI